MNIERFKQQHREILTNINDLRNLSRSGIQENAIDIAARVKSLGELVTRHLAIEDRILYPMVQDSKNPALAAMGRQYQEQMGHIATPFIAFTRQFSNARAVLDSPEDFRAGANTVLKRVYERMKQEDREFYPAIENA
ncbi:MAG TPA: hemerythrin domain-containing protein [Burkholderiaceae bacterium]|nr:hemerythrin domain-containing protein [Burkholderiaceae bacterium]